MLIRYRDLHLFLLDPQRRLYDSLSLASATSSYAAELKAARKGQPSERLPGRPGSKRTRGQAKLTRPRARLRPLRLTMRIGPVRARAYLLQAGTVRERLWYASTIPRPPASVRALLRKGTGESAAGSFNRALSGQSGRIPLRIDQPKGRRWRTVLRTTSITRRAVGAGALEPPPGYKRRHASARTSGGASARAASVPADPVRCGILVFAPISCRVGDGPVSAHPDLWAFYWGTHFNDRTDFVSSINHALQNFVGGEFADPNSKDFWGPLAQYGVGRGRFLGYNIVDDNPDDSVGSWNFFDVEAFVLTHRFGSDAPNYWWRYSDHDPILAIFVDQAEVDASGWGGYHAFTPTEGLLFAFLAHPNMPWFIVKVPSVAALPPGRGSDDYRAAVDQTTERASHEFVEAATDPYPFISWADPLKQPIWEEGEIGDICAQGTISPWVKNTRVLELGTAFSTYWSNDDNACMPASRPTVSLAYPGGGGTYTWHAQVTFIAHADDLYDGSVTDANLRWVSDRDGPLGTGYIFTTSKLSPGTHHITVVATNSQGATRTAGPITVKIEVHPPTVRIDAPAGNTTVGADQKVNYRGLAFDDQDGDLNASATWSVDGTPVGTGALLFSHQIPIQGAHTVTLSATNSGGLTSSASIKVNVGPPTGKPNVLITAPVPPPGFTDLYFHPGEPITFTATADAQGVATISNAGYRWTDDHEGALGTGQTITHALSDSPQVHHVTVTVTDSLNRTATDTITVNIVPIIQ